MAVKKEPFVSKESEEDIRTLTGIPGLDELLQGGIPKGNLCLLSGACGTGKTIFGLQFAYNGAVKYNENTVYVTLEETPDRLMSLMKKFGWNIHPLVKERKISFIHPEVYDFEKLKRMIGDEIEKIKANRLVVDSFTLINAYMKSEFEARRALVHLDREIKKFNCTSLAVSDVKEASQIFSITGYEEFIVDGVIVLKLTPASKERGAHMRSIFVRKMRGTEHSINEVPMKFHKDGLRVYPGEEMF